MFSYSMAITVPKLHRLLSYLMIFILVFMATTGGLWSVAFRLLKYDKDSLKFLLRWHQGDFFSGSNGEFVRAPVCITIGAITVIFAISGILQIRFKSMLRNRNKQRRYHQWLALITGVPLMIMAVTGGTWAALRYVVRAEKTSIKWLLKLHQVIVMR